MHNYALQSLFFKIRIIISIINNYELILSLNVSLKSFIFEFECGVKHLANDRCFLSQVSLVKTSLKDGWPYDVFSKGYFNSFPLRLLRNN